MAFCTNCGKQLPEGAMFCPGCGSLTAQETSTNSKGRKTFYDGEIHKCPNCGEALKAFETICPSCKFELRGAKVSNTIKDFQDKLERAASEKQKIIIIKSFPIPNTKEDIFEFMILASSSFDVSYYLEHLHEDDISDAWLAKIEQCYQKAKLSFKETTDFIEIEDIYQRIKNECAEKENKIKNDIKKAKLDRERANDAEKFKKGKFKIVLIVFAILSALFSAVSFPDNILSGIIAIVMSALFITSFLIGINVIKAKFKNMHLLFAIFAFVLIIPYFLFFDTNSSNENHNKEFSNIEWEYAVLNEFLPQPEFTNGEIKTDTEKNLNLELYNVTRSDFLNYKQACIDFGYTERSETQTTSYFAVNSLGYKLTLYYYSSLNQLSIDLEIPEPSILLDWSAFIMGSIIPVPDSQYGRVVVNSDEKLELFLSESTISTLTSYSQKCKDKGFNIDASQNTNSFKAYNSNGYQINLSFNEKNAELSVILYDPIKRATINWSVIALMKPLPTPPSNVGESSSNYDWSYSVYILDVAKEDYENYVDECINQGFTIDQSRYENSFWGENRNGYEINISWEGNSTMYISVKNMDLF